MRDLSRDPVGRLLERRERREDILEGSETETLRGSHILRRCFL